ncbi:hypothetical protein BG53_01120 [Paenibacillus darwinianus]|uniref:Copper resistance protein CopC n=1 Tax=Paenibacillus darwinianus TaxID=1380763 RepID=A0A9W5S206_9BACL|nr:hypothetical protein [Paenibacillus darwinianus]EXX88905.1 hypothetical protein BG53_01120 [Paenibacillus darwinianus]EXX89128.1 hypothetical protein BG52_00430 [Paenibacillus darwinianus]EXX90459.1 hypothetical protein CH50_15335 [Paenibacillus darwinianus]
MRFVMKATALLFLAFILLPMAAFAHSGLPSFIPPRGEIVSPEEKQTRAITWSSVQPPQKNKADALELAAPSLSTPNVNNVPSEQPSDKAAPPVFVLIIGILLALLVVGLGGMANRRGRWQRGK